MIDPELPAAWPRCMPPQVAARVFRRNRQFYRDVGKSLEPIESAVLSKELANPLDCTVQLLSGCQDNQYCEIPVGNNGRIEYKVPDAIDEQEGLS